MRSIRHRARAFRPGWRNSFRRTNRDSGAIVVGAGAPPPGTHGRNHGPDRSRLDFSNWGALIDAQGWGREVTTCGYGDLQGGANEDLWYTDTFSGTSSASPIVTGAIACIQGMAKARGRPVLTPAQVRNCLRSTGSSQQDAPGRPATQRIGNRPDIRALATCAFGKGKELAKEVAKEFKEEGVKEFVKEKDTKELAKDKDTKEQKDKDTKEIKDKDIKEFKDGKEVKEKDKDLVEGKLCRWARHPAIRPRCAGRRHAAASRGARADDAAARALHQHGAAARSQPVGAAGKQ